VAGLDKKGGSRRRGNWSSGRKMLWLVKRVVVERIRIEGHRFLWLRGTWFKEKVKRGQIRRS
jgi:hypothetical protein